MPPSICRVLTLRAVKKIKLRDVRNDKIFREVSALSRLNHRFIVRYYTTWVETSDAPSLPILGSESEDSDMTEQTTTGPTSKPKASTDSSEEHLEQDDTGGMYVAALRVVELGLYGRHPSDDKSGSLSVQPYR